jgi:hypothetical protein
MNDIQHPLLKVIGCIHLEGIEKGLYFMQGKLDLLGAVVANGIFISSTITFASRTIFKLHPGH